MKKTRLKSNLLFGTKRDRWAFSVVLCVGIFSALVTFLSIFSIYPLLQLMTDYEVTVNQFPMANVKEAFPDLDEVQFISMITLLTMVVLLVSMLTQILENVVTNGFCALKEMWISGAIYENFLTDSYKLFQQKNTSEEAKNILSDSNAAVGLFIRPIMQLVVASSTIMVLIGSMLLINAQIGASIILLASFLYLFIYSGLRKVLMRTGRARTSSNEDRFKLVDDAISSMAEIKIHDAVNIFATDFTKTSKRYALSVVWSKVIAVVPKFLIEGLGAISIVFYMRSMFLDSGTIETLIPDLAIYVFILYRLLPQIQKVYSSFTSLKYSDNFVDSISDRARKKDTYNERDVYVPKFSPQTINSIKLKNLSFKFEAGGSPIIDDFSINFKIGCYYSIVGPSGSGKTCLLNIISGLNDDYGGTFIIEGRDFRDMDLKKYWEKVSYVPQDAAIFNGTIAQNVALSGLPEINRSRVESSLEMANFGVQILCDSSLSIDTLVGTGGQKLSGGQKQRIAIARAMYKAPNVLILDEATSALDEESESIVLQNIKNNKDIMTISVAHRASAIEIADFKIQLDD